jgi:ketosteroid isomerase-like protein
MMPAAVFPGIVAVLALMGTAVGTSGQQERTAAADSAAVVEVIRQFHEALAAGDSSAVLRLLHDDAVILESGGMETKEEYRGHHLPADIAFARAVPRQPGAVRVTVLGDAAWASSMSVTRGRFRDRDVNSQSAELMVLERHADGWVISAIHWSSRTLR